MFLDKMESDEAEEFGIENEESENCAYPPIPLKTKKIIKTNPDPQQKFFPFFLAKMNSTYFKKVNTQFLQSQLPKNKKKPRLHSKGHKDNQDKLQSLAINTEPQQAKIFAKHESPSQFNKIYQTSSREIKNETNQLASIRSEQQQQQQQYQENNAKFEAQIKIQKQQNQEEDVQKNSIELPKYYYKSKSYDFGKNHIQTNCSLQSDQQNPQNTTLQACLICFDNEPNAVNMPCGHGGICYNCSFDLMQKNGECYLCRQEIEEILQLDLKQKDGKNLIKVIKSVKFETQMHQKKQII